MENQPTKLDKAVKISVLVGILVVALSVASYFVISLLQKERVRIDQQKQEQQAKEQKEKIEKEILSQKEDDQAYIWLIQNPDDARAKEVKNKLLEKNYKPKEPSERALKAANFLALVSSNIKKDMISTYGNGSGDINVAVHNFALYLDSDIEKLISLEALIEQDKTNKSTLNTGSSASSSQPSDATSFFDDYEQKWQQECQEDMNKYNSCMNDYNSELGEYNSCLSEGKRSFCFKPLKSCYKPYCSR